MARVRQSRPDFDLGVGVTVLEAFWVVSSSLGSKSGVDPSTVCRQVVVVLPSSPSGGAGPLSREHGTCKTVKASFWPCLSGKVVQTFQVVSFSLVGGVGFTPRSVQRGVSDFAITPVPLGRSDASSSLSLSAQVLEKPCAQS